MTDMSAAANILTDANQKLGAAQEGILAAVDGEMSAAKELVRMIFAAGFELPGLHESLGMIEECENDAHAVISKLEAARAKIDEVKGS